MDTSLTPAVVRDRDFLRQKLNWWASGAPWRRQEDAQYIEGNKLMLYCLRPSLVGTTRYGLRAVL